MPSANALVIPGVIAEIFPFFIDLYLQRLSQVTHLNFEASELTLIKIFAVEHAREFAASFSTEGHGTRSVIGPKLNRSLSCLSSPPAIVPRRLLRRRFV